jgi:hypothetical protein
LMYQIYVTGKSMRCDSKTNWSEWLGDAVHWLPLPIYREVQASAELTRWPDPIETLIFLRIILAIKQGKFDKATGLIDGACATTKYPNAMLLLRARIHFMCAEYEQFSMCLEAVAKFDENDLQPLAKTIDFRSLAKHQMRKRDILSNDRTEPTQTMVDVQQGGPQDIAAFMTRTSYDFSSSQAQESINASPGAIANSRSQSLLKRRNAEFLYGNTNLLYPGRSALKTTVTIFCAVYHRDENRHALIEEHLDNVKSQSFPVEPIYIFEAGDEPPSAAKSYSIVNPSRLSIYQAWHIAMQHSNSKLLINLNLDDRLCPDAIAKMSNYFDSDEVMLVGGDWIIQNRIAKSDQLSKLSIRETYFDPTWPPKKNACDQSQKSLRLGSGTGERGTYGPSTMFRRNLLEDIPYPLRFGNGDLVESIGDSLWWSLIKQRYPAGAARMPEIIGIYHSNPSSQAEFRVTNEWEKFQKWGLE